MTAPSAPPVRCGADLFRLERIDGLFLKLARTWDAEEVQFPVLIDQATLARAEYFSAFPHLLITACGCVDPAAPLAELLYAANLAPTLFHLSPAVCYHAYSRWLNDVVKKPRVLTARGRCFRKEAEFSPGRRQIEFEMREIVFCGEADWVESKLSSTADGLRQIADSLGIKGTWILAEDPFFLPSAKGKRLMQRLHETKKEFVTSEAEPLALASINRHGVFFGERFGISFDDGRPVHTACVAFGLDRWAELAKIS